MHFIYSIYINIYHLKISSHKISSQVAATLHSRCGAAGAASLPQLDDTWEKCEESDAKKSVQDAWSIAQEIKLCMKSLPPHPPESCRKAKQLPNQQPVYILAATWNDSKSSYPFKYHKSRDQLIHHYFTTLKGPIDSLNLKNTAGMFVLK